MPIAHPHIVAQRQFRGLNFVERPLGAEYQQQFWRATDSFERRLAHELTRQRLDFRCERFDRYVDVDADPCAAQQPGVGASALGNRPTTNLRLVGCRTDGLPALHERTLAGGFYGKMDARDRHRTIAIARKRKRKPQRGEALGEPGDRDVGGYPERRRTRIAVGIEDAGGVDHWRVALTVQITAGRYGQTLCSASVQAISCSGRVSTMRTLRASRAASEPTML